MTQSPYVVVGAFARIDVARQVAVRADLERIDGVSTFDLERPEMLGLLIEASDVDAAHATLVERVRRSPGVLGVWPVSVESDDGFERAVTAGDRAGSGVRDRGQGATGDSRR